SKRLSTEVKLGPKVISVSWLAYNLKEPTSPVKEGKSKVSNSLKPKFREPNVCKLFALNSVRLLSLILMVVAEIKLSKCNEVNMLLENITELAVWRLLKFMSVRKSGPAPNPWAETKEAKDNVEGILL